MGNGRTESWGGRLWALAVPVLVATAVGAGLAACSGLQRSEGFSGACKAQLSRCRKACDERVDPSSAYGCGVGCEQEARWCSERQGEAEEFVNLGPSSDRRNVSHLGTEDVQRVDFAAGRIDSSGASVTAGGEARLAGDVYELMPGGWLKITFRGPPDARASELRLVHGAGGGGLPCFVTISLADKPLAARYSAPRRELSGKLKTDAWDTTRHLPPPAPQAAATAPLTLFIYNNAEADSRSPYFVRRIEFATRAPEGAAHAGP